MVVLARLVQPDVTMTTGDRRRRDRLASVVDEALRMHLQAAQALRQIRDERLYRESHSNFESYVADRWGLSRAHGNRLITWAEVAENLSPIGDTLLLESHARPLAKLPAKQQRDVWDEYVKTGEPTQRSIERAVADALGHGAGDDDEQPHGRAVGMLNRLIGDIIRVTACVHPSEIPPAYRPDMRRKLLEIREGVDQVVQELDRLGRPLTQTPKTDGKIHLDLFSGIGGFARGAEVAGVRFDKSFHSEIDPFANAIYARHYPQSHSLGDIRHINGHDLRKVNPGHDWVITGGFPCQDISIAGKRKGIGTQVEPTDRSGLWWQMFRLIKEIQPRWVIIENVKALIQSGLTAILQSLASIGFDADWQTISASKVGAPHLRERVWITAWPSAYSNCDRFGALGEHIESGRNVGNGPQADSQANGCRPRPDRQAEGSDAWPTWKSAAASAAIPATPRICRVDDGPAHRLDLINRRLKALSNAVVPQMAATVFRQLGLHEVAIGRCPVRSERKRK